MIQMILKIDAGANFDDMSDALKEAIQRAGVQWPEGRLVGTVDYNGERLILIQSKIDGETLTDWMNGYYPTTDPETGEGELIDFTLGWEVVAEEGKKIDQAKLLKYFNPNPVFDEDGNQIGEEPVTDLTEKLQTWAGKSWLY